MATALPPIRHELSAPQRFGAAPAILAILLTAAAAGAGDIERDPINYSTAPENNAISRLQQRIDAGGVSLTFDDHFGYLPALLKELKVPESSQMLVFSKTSFQRQCITPRTPRAVYFNDDNYVGYCQNGEVLEFITIDPQLGSVFCTLDQEKAAKPQFARQNDDCLICHGSSTNQGMPGQLLRSTYTGPDGLPLLNLGGFRTDQTSPLKERWGGWYVTGRTGKERRLGNLIVRGKPDPTTIGDAAVQNVTDLSRWVDRSDYLAPGSDIVALMVLEHQIEMHNRIARANYCTRMALYDESELNKALGQPNAPRSDLTTRRIKSACEPLVEYMLFSGEARLGDRVEGTSDFAKEFAARGP
ncbi:MAG TPA: hypothetical protein VMS17_20655, partial [Gemmataceae bacterium]|nr:hypothetical protein [Gemmataceae bacterium]